MSSPVDTIADIYAQGRDCPNPEASRTAVRECLNAGRTLSLVVKGGALHIRKHPRYPFVVTYVRRPERPNTTDVPRSLA